MGYDARSVQAFAPDGVGAAHPLERRLVELPREGAEVLVDEGVDPQASPHPRQGAVGLPGAGQSAELHGGIEGDAERVVDVEVHAHPRGLTADRAGQRRLGQGVQVPGGARLPCGDGEHHNALAAARRQLGTSTIKDTVNVALRRAAEERDQALDASLEFLAETVIDDRSAAWR